MLVRHCDLASFASVRQFCKDFESGKSCILLIQLMPKRYRRGIYRCVDQQRWNHVLAQI